MAVSVSFVSERLSLHIHKVGCLTSPPGAVKASKLCWISKCMGGFPMGGPGTFFHNQGIQIVQNLLTVEVVRRRRRL